MKKKMKINIIFVFSLALILILFNTCKRATPDQGSPAININTPFSPTGFATTLKLSASPNIISAGTTPEVSAVTVTLTKTGAALSGKTIIFAIYDELGNKIDLGYFEGNEFVTSKVTDSNGIATVNYYGPLASELAGNTVVNIGATVSGIGDESISGNAPIYIIADITEITFDVYANPNALVAGTTRGTSTITATLKTSDGIALSNQTIIFEIWDELGNKINTGYFTGNEYVATQLTNENGIATVTYFGPLAWELNGNVTVYIRATAALEGKEDISETTPINIIQDFIETRLNIYNNPTVLTAGIVRQTSTITATLMTAVDGTPLANWNIRFEITDVGGNRIYVGYFDSNKQVVTKVTDATGTATTTYYGPLLLELPTFVGYITIYIRVTAWLGEVSVSEMAPIYIY